MDLVLYNGLKYGQGGGGPETQKFCGRHISIALKTSSGTPLCQISPSPLGRDRCRKFWAGLAEPNLYIVRESPPRSRNLSQ